MIKGCTLALHSEPAYWTYSTLAVMENPSSPHKQKFLERQAAFFNSINNLQHPLGSSLFFYFLSLSKMNLSSASDRVIVQCHNGAPLTDENIQQLLAQAEQRLCKNTETVSDSITPHQAEQSIPKYDLYSHGWWNGTSWLRGANNFAL